MMVNVRHDRISATRRGLGLAALVAMLAVVGCKSRDGKGGMFSSGPSRNADPLVVGPGRIPKQNLPVPGRDTAGKGRTDPLLGSPTGRTVDRRGGYTSDPERWKNGPYLPGPDGTPASLAARTRDDDEGLKISARRRRPAKAGRRGSPGNLRRRGKRAHPGRTGKIRGEARRLQHRAGEWPGRRAGEGADQQ